MPIAVVLSFVVVFVLVLMAVSVGLKFFDARRKKQVSDMLQTASGETPVQITNLLKDIDPDRPTGIKHLLASLQFSRHAQEQIQQAGLNWSPSRLLTAMGLAMIPGLGLGAWSKVLLNGTTSAVVFALITGTIPYLIVRHKRTVRLNTLEEQFPDSLDFLARSMRAGHALCRRPTSDGAPVVVAPAVVFMPRASSSSYPLPTLRAPSHRRDYR